MQPDIPIRNIPVKHAYSPLEFGGPGELDTIDGMNNVAAIRKAKGLSQTDLAELAGVEQPTISKLERGNQSITLRTLMAVAEALQVPLSDLFADRSDAERAIIQAYRSLPEQRRRGWQDMARAVTAEDGGDHPQQDEGSGRIAG